MNRSTAALLSSRCFSTSVLSVANSSTSVAEFFDGSGIYEANAAKIDIGTTLWSKTQNFLNTIMRPAVRPAFPHTSAVASTLLNSRKKKAACASSAASLLPRGLSCSRKTTAGFFDCTVYSRFSICFTFWKSSCVYLEMSKHRIVKNAFFPFVLATYVQAFVLYNRCNIFHDLYLNLSYVFRLFLWFQ